MKVRLCQPEKHRDRPVNREHDIIVESADGGAELGAADRWRTIDRDLRGDLQAILIGGRDTIRVRAACCRSLVCGKTTTVESAANHSA